MVLGASFHVVLAISFLDLKAGTHSKVLVFADYNRAVLPLNKVLEVLSN